MSKNNIRKVIRKHPWIVPAAIIVFVAMYLYSTFFILAVKDGEAQVHFINADQGDAALILTNSASVLIDSGTTKSGKEVAAYIDNRLDSLDYVIFSHPHEDHIGGAKYVLEAVDVKHVIMPDYTEDSTSFDRMIEAIENSNAEVIPAKKGLTVELGDLLLEFLSPAEGADFEDANNVSAVVRVTYGKTSFMFTGDAEAVVEEELISDGNLRKCDVLKVGHHGSSTSSTEDFIRILSPDFAVISCGRGNSYGHPHHEVTERLENIGAQILRTDLDGTIVIISDGKSVKLK